MAREGSGWADDLEEAASRIESVFWPAEDYHQDYYRNHPIRYKTYRAGCGRDARLRNLWDDEAYQH